jgi:hypothetical protein
MRWFGRHGWVSLAARRLPLMPREYRYRRFRLTVRTSNFSVIHITTARAGSRHKGRQGAKFAYALGGKGARAGLSIAASTIRQ